MKKQVLSFLRFQFREILLFVGGLEALASEFAAGAIIAAVIVRGRDKAIFLFGAGTSKEELSPS